MNRMEKAFQEDCARNMARSEPGINQSKQLAEQAIAGMADIVRELDELRQIVADADARYARQDEIHGIALQGLNDDKRELLAERARLRAKWNAIPWSTLNHCELILTSYNRLIESVDTRNRADEMREWLDANMPKGNGE